MRVAYADPPYLGSAAKHYSKFHARARDFDRVRAHQDLVKSLVSDYPDGWALSLSSVSLQQILLFCPTDVRIGAWVKPFASFKPGVNPAYCWEPVIFSGGRPLGREVATVRDYCSAGVTVGRGTPGAKPQEFCFWVFQMLGLEPMDELEDLFPGSGAVSTAWDSFRRQYALFG